MGPINAALKRLKLLTITLGATSTADGLQRARLSISLNCNVAILAVVTKGLSSHISPVLAYDCFARCKFSTLSPRQLIIVEFYLQYSRSHAFRYGSKN